MLLAVDIGNTNIVAGVYAEGALVAHWRLATDRRRMPDEYAVLFDSLLDRAGLRSDHVSAVVIAGVVPGVQSALLESVRENWGIEPLVLTRDLDLGIDVRAQGAGADRIANAVAAVHRYGRPAIVVDFGTTTNFDVVSADGAYVGGAIAPGLEISQQALVSQTAQLPYFPLEAPPSAIGNTTLYALQSGILFGYGGLVDRIVELISAELGGHAHVIATGGLARVVAPLARTIQGVDDDITLEGLRLIYDRNVGSLEGTRSRQD
jgi:type III pantothenate kinase